MLVLTRKAEQSLVLGNNITITVLAVEGERVKLGIQAPREVTVLRQEIHEQLQAANTSAATQVSGDAARLVAAALRSKN